MTSGYYLSTFHRYLSQSAYLPFQQLPLILSSLLPLPVHPLLVSPHQHRHPTLIPREKEKNKQWFEIVEIRHLNCSQALAEQIIRSHILCHADQTTDLFSIQ